MGSTGSYHRFSTCQYGSRKILPYVPVWTGASSHEMMYEVKTKTSGSAKGGRGRSHRSESLRPENATFSIGLDAREQIAWLVGRHVTVEARAALSASEVIRDLVERAYRRARSKER